MGLKAPTVPTPRDILSLALRSPFGKCAMSLMLGGRRGEGIVGFAWEAAELRGRGGVGPGWPLRTSHLSMVSLCVVIAILREA